MTTMTPSLEDATQPDRQRRIRFFHRPRMVAVALFVASLVLSASLSLARWPEPSVHDEFSYLLAADTFCEGRLTNPPHPQWHAFESFHIIQQPTYASKYPPGQGLALALGQWLTGEPLVGVWIVTACGVLAVFWMALGWTTVLGATTAGLLFLSNPWIQVGWGQTYWGGTLALVGGALVFGAAGRMSYRTRVGDAVAMAAGAGILAVTRPFEGMCFCVFTGAWLISLWQRRGWPRRRELLWKNALPQTVVLATCGAGLAVYHDSVTGDPWTWPYMVHESSYAQAPMFVWQSPTVDRAYRHEMIAQFHDGWAMDWYRVQQTLGGLLATKAQTAQRVLTAFIPPLLALPLLAVARLRSWRLRSMMAVAALTWLAALPSVWNFPHYLAPIAPVVILICVFGLRGLHRVLRPWPWGRFAAPAIIAIQAVSFVATAAQQISLPQSAWQWRRAELAEQLQELPGDDLVIVRYDPSHNPRIEWVYNRAAIDSASVVWARELAGDEGESLRRYFANRRAWLLEADADPPRLTEYASRPTLARTSASSGGLGTQEQIATHHSSDR